VSDRTWAFFAAATMAAVLTAGGCSTGSAERDIGAARVEPELQASPRASVPRAAGSVPVVIAAARPYTSARPAPAVHHAGEPRRLPPAAEPVRQDAAERGEIAAMLGSYLRDFNRHDAAAVVGHWSEHGENLDLDTGDVTRGREAVRGVFATLFAEDAEAAIDIDVQAIRPVRHDVALVDGTSTVRFGDGGRAGSRFSAVVVKQDGRWLLESVREAPQPEAASSGQPLEQLAWLIGSWDDMGPGVAASTRCFWSAGNAFLIRAHAVAADGAAEPRPLAGDAGIPGLLPAADVADREVTEIIGWDPESQLIRSWVFASTGRFAEGTWTREGDDWKVRFEGRGADAGLTSECVMVRRGADELVVRGAGDGLAGALVPVCDFIRSAR
jgi:uncharacterized protein (TIGR02246 family)